MNQALPDSHVRFKPANTVRQPRPRQPMTVPRWPAKAVALSTLVLACLAPLDTRAQPSPDAALTVAEHTSDGEHWRDPRCRGPVDASTFARTELFFGLSRPGGVITDDDFKNFVDARVTPRFPDGLTLLSGVGQFRDSSGTTIVEGSKLLVLLYPRSDRGASERIEQIRNDYRWQFQQQSVLRADDLSCVSF
jgi:hypothetical protein